MSNIIVRPRRGGKTYEIVQWVLDGEKTDSYPGWSRVLITQSIAESDRIRKDFPALDYRQVFSWSEWKNARLGKRPVDVAIDNADNILASLLGQTVARATWNGEVE